MHNLLRTNNCWCVLLSWMLCVNKFTNGFEYSNHVNDFIRHFTTLFNQNALSYQEKYLDYLYLNAAKQHFSPSLYNYPEYGIPPGLPARPQKPLPPHDSPFSDSGLNLLPGSFPTYPQKPHIAPPFGAYPQGLFVSALSSIAKYDDLHCIPRLFCEVTSGNNITSSNKSTKDDVSPIPFLSKDAIITLLTVMNFVDDSPILLFARAAVLGYTSKGNSEVCLNAYPLCPRDPDQLVNYLNNHNGGFFRFFNHQLKQQPQYSPYVKKHFNDTDRTKRYRDVKFPPRAPKFEFATRILNDPIEIEEDENYGKTSKTNVPTRYHKDDKFVFSSSSRPQLDLSHDNNEYNSVHATRVGKKIFFPKDVIKSFTTNVMIFPDRTGTGNLILSGSPSYGLKISFSGDPHKKLKSKIKFSNENQRYSKKIRFPKEEK